MQRSVGAGDGIIPVPERLLFRWVLRVAAVLALAVVTLGATVRLNDAGLSCPDWPGCYGQPTVSAAQALPTDHLAERWPAQPLDPARARLEMLHRYLAGTLGLLIAGITVAALRGGRTRGWLCRYRAPALVLAALVLLQAMLGMWTVTLRLEPLIVMAHLLGGFGTLALLWWLVLIDAADSIAPDRVRERGPVDRRTRRLAAAALGLLALQIALGGWVAANHATLACTGFPSCNGAWWPPADFGDGFGGMLTGAGDGRPSGPGLIAIHWTHRLGALAVALVVGTLVLRGLRLPAVRAAAAAVGFLLASQIGLGIATVLAGAPLPLAIAHHAVAALLLLAVLTVVKESREKAERKPQMGANVSKCAQRS